MYSFGGSSKERRDTCHPDLIAILDEAIKGPYDFAITCGHRNQAAQMVAYESGLSQVNWPDSRHNTYPSRAVDLAPYPINWSDHPSFALLAGYVMATAERLLIEGKISHRLRWGGDWNTNGKTKDHKFSDFPHFELVDTI